MHSLALKDRKGEFKVGRIHPRFSYFGLHGMMGGNIFLRSILQQIRSWRDLFFKRFVLREICSSRFVLQEICSLRDSFFETFVPRFLLREVLWEIRSPRGSLKGSLREVLRERFFKRFYPLRYPWEKDLLRISRDPSRDSSIDSSFSIVVELMMEEVQVRFFERIFFFYFHGMNVRERAGAYKWEYILLQKIFHPIVDGWHAGCLTNFIHTNKVAELKEGGFAHHATYQALHSDTNLA